MAPLFLSGTEHTSLALLGCQGVQRRPPFGGESSTLVSICLSLRSCNQLQGLCNEKGLFLGILGIATTDFLGQESDLLTIRAAPAKHPITTVCHSMQWPFGHSFEGEAKPL